MTALASRKSRLVVETSDTERLRGKLRAVILECDSPYFCHVRLKGTRARLPISYAAIYELAAKKEAERQRAERKARASRRGSN